MTDFDTITIITRLPEILQHCICFSNVLLHKDVSQTAFVNEDGLNRSINAHTAITRINQNSNCQLALWHTSENFRKWRHILPRKDLLKWFPVTPAAFTGDSFSIVILKTEQIWNQISLPRLEYRLSIREPLLRCRSLQYLPPKSSSEYFQQRFLALLQPLEN